MIQLSIARRYAKGLFAVGEKNGKYRDYLSQMQDILSAVATQPRLEKALMIPILEMDKRKEILSDVIKALATEPIVAALLRLLMERNRINYLSRISEAYEEMVNEKEGKVKGTGFSAYPLSDDAQKRIEAAIGEKLNKKVQLDFKEDKALLGGISVIVGGMRIDGSVRRQLELLNESMMKE